MSTQVLTFILTKGRRVLHYGSRLDWVPQRFHTTFRNISLAPSLSLLHKHACAHTHILYLTSGIPVLCASEDSFLDTARTQWYNITDIWWGKLCEGNIKSWIINTSIILVSTGFELLQSNIYTMRWKSMINGEQSGPRVRLCNTNTQQSCHHHLDGNERACSHMHAHTHRCVRGGGVCLTTAMTRVIKYLTPSCQLYLRSCLTAVRVSTGLTGWKLLL